MARSRFLLLQYLIEQLTTKITTFSYPKNQAQEVNFSRKTTKTIYLQTLFGNTPVNKANFWKHLKLDLYSKLSFYIHIKTILTNEELAAGILRKFQELLPRPFLITIYIDFMRSYIDLGDNIIDQSSNSSFRQILESFQCTATSAIKGISKEKFCQELGFETLKSSRWFRKFFLFSNKIKSKPPSIELLPPKPLTSYSPRNC